MKNYSEEVRKSVLMYYGYISELFGYNSKSDENICKGISTVFWNSLNTFDSDARFKIFTTPFLYAFENKNAYNIPDIAKFLSVTSKLQMFTDFYRLNRYGNIVEDKPSKDLSSIDSYEFINIAFQDHDLANVMLYALANYEESSGYKKILLDRCLNEKDVETLSKINPFFKEEYDKSNIPLDLEFIKKHIGKWQKSFPNDEDESYVQSADFIMKLYKINKDEATALLSDLFRQDLGILDYKGDDEDIIKIGQVTINHRNLALMLKDYYKYETQTLKK